MESNIPAEYPSKPWQPLFDYLSGLCEIPPTLSEMEDLINVVEKMIGHKSLQARCDRYEKALKEIAKTALVVGQPSFMWQANEALNGEGKEELPEPGKWNQCTCTVHRIAAHGKCHRCPENQKEDKQC